MMINDLKKALKFTHGLLYADDKTIIVTSPEFKIYEYKNKDLKTLSQQLTDKTLTLNV